MGEGETGLASERGEVHRAMAAIAVAIAGGLLEAAWTGPSRGAPTNTWLGILALLIALLAVTWPRVWWVPGLAILEEGTHLFVG